MSSTGGQAAGGQPRATSWVEVVRLRTLPAAVAPVILGAGAAAAQGAFSAPRSLLAAGVALALQIGCNLANDYSDGVRGTDDQRTGPPRLTASGEVAPGAVKAAAFGCFGVGAVLGLVILALSGQWWMLVLGAGAIAAAWFYTGGPRPYGYAGLGEVFVFVFFGLVAACGTLYIQSGAVPGWAWVAATGIGLLACSLLMVNNLRDIRTDPAAGKRTLAVRLGERRARAAFIALLVAPLPLGAVALGWAHWADGDGAPRSVDTVAVGAFIVFIVAVAAMVRRAAAPMWRGAWGRALIPVLRDAGLTELVYGVAFAMAVVAVTR